MASHTLGRWRVEALGGASTVLCQTKPVRNDTRIPPYGYKDGGEHCIGYPFIKDDGDVRLDFVCFSNKDARLIAAAPLLLEALQETDRLLCSIGAINEGSLMHRQIRAAVIAATGERS